MTDEQKAAYIFSQSVFALGQILGMQAENQMRSVRSYGPAYDHSDFAEIVEPLAHDTVIGIIQK